MAHLMEQRICINFCFNLGKLVSETYEMLQNAFCDDAMGRQQTSEWYSYFKETSLWLRILNVQIAQHQTGLTKIRRKCMKSHFRTDGLELMIYVTF
jgi:hypothetical protein